MPLLTHGCVPLLTHWHVSSACSLLHRWSYFFKSYFRELVSPIAYSLTVCQCKDAGVKHCLHHLQLLDLWLSAVTHPAHDNHKTELLLLLPAFSCPLTHPAALPLHKLHLFYFWYASMARDIGCKQFYSWTSKWQRPFYVWYAWPSSISWLSTLILFNMGWIFTPPSPHPLTPTPKLWTSKTSNLIHD